MAFPYMFFLRQVLIVLSVVLSLNLVACSPSQRGIDLLDIDVKSRETGSSVNDPDIQRRSEALHYFLLGQLSYINEDYKSAIDNFSRASDLTDIPASLIHTKLAELHLKQGNLDKALAESELAVTQDPALTYNLLLKAGILEALGKGSEAEPLYQRIIQTKPDTFDAYVYLSALYQRSGNQKKSIDTLRALVKRAPKESFSFFYLAQALENQGDMRSAEVEFEKAHALDPANINIALARVRVYLKLQKRAEALALCQKIVEQSPENQAARKVLGHLLLGENRLEDALKHLAALEGLEGDPTDTRYKIALIQIERKNLHEAERELTLVLAQKPAHEQARYYLATVYSGSGRRGEAIEELIQIENDPVLVTKARTYAAFLLRQEQSYEEAEEQIRYLFDRKLGDKTTFSYLVLILRDQRKFSEAEDMLRDALDDDPKNEGLLFNLGLVLDDLKEGEEALAMMQQVIAINPRNSEALNYIAYYLADNGESLDKAIKYSTEALQIKPRDGYYLDTLGWIYFKQGKFSDAVQVLADAVQAIPDDAVILEHYADALFKSGDSKRALEVYQSIFIKAKVSSEDERKKLYKHITKKISRLQPS
jgi:tetratricopeptide (TPR) repeat protein